ncbi:ribulose-phosphate 3-epimerase [Mycoplasmopsis gallinacea]|uniref:D-ribulose-5-phosphate 3 epimerase n=1 Tax=Mycoplasmopsis gallinacea TaxID=29556 RepID=A0A449A2K3_9BACT|nr:ribulose-phosphate 3-epimerase [Mycoplasmopsis gallinacea]VEU58423.1 d-ribulose-5-phosphate 3 epimerase [Mycoplasmopsis gallinacea]
MAKYVTPSLLNVEPENRLKMANTLVNEGIRWIHYDIMDGEFVPNTAIKIKEIENINQHGLAHIKDAHLMVVEPYEYFESVKNHVDIVTFHYEAIEDDLERFEEFLNENQHEFKIGLAIKPNTPVEAIKSFLSKLTLVLVMSVEPGKGGQKFIETSIDKIKNLREERNKHGYEFLIQVDGGINDTTGPLCFAAGADACVAGTFLVKNPTKATIDSILGKFAK